MFDGLPPCLMGDMTWGNNPTLSRSVLTSLGEKCDTRTHRKPWRHVKAGTAQAKVGKGGVGANPAGKRLASDIRHRMDTRQEG